MSTIRFSYRDAKGEVSQRELAQWAEYSDRIQGWCPEDGFPRTFRKDRILEFLHGVDLLLHDAAPPAPAPSPRSAAQANQILFTGFAAAVRTELEQHAAQAGLQVMKTAGKALTFLCYGANAGPAKLAKAHEAGAYIIDSEQFLHLVKTGELP